MDSNRPLSNDDDFQHQLRRIAEASGAGAEISLRILLAAVLHLQESLARAVDGLSAPQPAALPSPILIPTDRLAQPLGPLVQPLDLLAQPLDLLAQPLDLLAQPLDLFAPPIDPFAPRFAVEPHANPVEPLAIPATFFALPTEPLVPHADRFAGVTLPLLIAEQNVAAAAPAAPHFGAPYIGAPHIDAPFTPPISPVPFERMRTPPVLRFYCILVGYDIGVFEGPW